MEHWIQSLDFGICTDVIYLDITIAFDTVPHAQLLSKLKAYSIEIIFEMHYSLLFNTKETMCCTQWM